MLRRVIYVHVNTSASVIEREAPLLLMDRSDVCVTPTGIYQVLWCQNTRVCRLVCMICLVILMKHVLVMDR